jgi:hypothetical protein
MILELLFTAAQAAAAPSAPPPNPQPVLVRRQAPKPVVSGTDTCLPLQFAGAMPVITASLGGRTLKFAFDTGAPGGPHINNSVVEQLKLTQIGEARVSDPSMRNPLAVGIYEIKDMKLGGFRIESWQATGHVPRPDRLYEPDGVMGVDAFAGYVVTFDYPASRILISKGRLPEADGKTSFKYQGSIPRVPLTISGKAIEAHLDTGNARYGLIIPRSFAEQLPGGSASFPIGIARTVNNQFDMQAFPVSDAKVGDIPLFAGTAAFPSPSPRGNVGSLILRDFVVKVDPANGIVALERAKAGLENGCPKA